VYRYVAAWDRTSGKPLHNAVVWLDTRTSALCEALVAEFESKEHFRATSGLPISTYFSAMKMRWLLDNAPAVKEAAAAAAAAAGAVSDGAGGDGCQLCFGTVGLCTFESS
jgi:glycerol kinase